MIIHPWSGGVNRSSGQRRELRARIERPTRPDVTSDVGDASRVRRSLTCSSRFRSIVRTTLRIRGRMRACWLGEGRASLALYHEGTQDDLRTPSTRTATARMSNVTRSATFTVAPGPPLKVFLLKAAAPTENVALA